MSARVEVENEIRNGWTDKKVAEWVISNFPLLEHGFSHEACPIYELSLRDGLVAKNVFPFVREEFRAGFKIVMSGGFEGTRGHFEAIDSLWEYRLLAADTKVPIVLMLESDSYIKRVKFRNPILSLQQRVELWSTSGFVDSLITMPDRPINMSAAEYFTQVQSAIEPASWCVSVENNSWAEILVRGEINRIIDGGRLFTHSPNLHTSFLSSTRNKSYDATRESLWRYSAFLARDRTIFIDNYPLSESDRTLMIFKQLSRGL